MLKSRHVLKALNALAQESRLAVFKLLAKQGPGGLASGEIAKRLDIPAATLSFHLNHLSNAKLINSRKEGRSIIYSANYERMQLVLEYLLDRLHSSENQGELFNAEEAEKKETTTNS